MDEKEFKLGDVVQLKSGSPKMTVIEVGKAGEKLYIGCKWFLEGKPHYNEFPSFALCLSN